jgi:hypothetical protein
MAEEMKNVNATENNEVKDQKQEQQQPEKADEKKKEKVTWRLGPVSIDLNPKVAKALKAVGIGGAIVVTGLIGDRIGSGRKGKADRTVIDGQAQEIDRLNALLDSAPAQIPETVEPVEETTTEAVEEFTE